LSITAAYYYRGYLKPSERWAIIANLRLGDDYLGFGQRKVEVPDEVRTIIREVLGADDRATATTFGLVRWTKVMKAFIADLDDLVDQQLAKLQRQISTERSTIGWNVEFGACSWLVMFGVMIPVLTVTATRTVANIHLYSKSCADEALRMKHEMHMTDALLREMLPRSDNSPHSSAHTGWRRKSGTLMHVT